MRNKNLIIGLSLIVVFQLIILGAEYANAVYPIWTGQEIRLRTTPIDPRSMFRGNYARLQYEISEISGVDINMERVPRNGEIVYIKLKEKEAGIYAYDGAGLEKPLNGLFIRGRIQANAKPFKSERYRVKYGIEALFAPKKKALSLEKRLRKHGVAKVMIAPNGKAALLDVVGKE